MRHSSTEYKVCHWMYTQRLVSKPSDGHNTPLKIVVILSSKMVLHTNKIPISTMAAKEAFLVLGATGNQGGATVSGLLASSPDCAIHVLLRDVSTSKAQALQTLSPNIRLFSGSYDDKAAIAAAAAGVTGAFVNVSMVFTDFDAEQRHVQNILDALVPISTMKRVVFASVTGAKDPSVPGNLKDVEPGTFRYAYFANKFKNEALVQKVAEDRAWAWTILQPAVFLTNWLPPLVEMVQPKLREHKIETAFPENYKHFYVDPRDTGRFAAHALLGKANLQNQRILLANEHLSLEELLGELQTLVKERTGQEVDITIDRISMEDALKVKDTDLRIGSELQQINNPPYVDLAKVKSYGIEMGCVASFFTREFEALRGILL